MMSRKSFDPTPKKPASPTDCQVFVKSWSEEPLSDAPSKPSETGSKSRDDQELKEWLRGRDSLSFPMSRGDVKEPKVSRDVTEAERPSQLNERE